MKTRVESLKPQFVAIAIFLLAICNLHAQIPGGGFFGNFGGNTSRNTSTTRQYPNNGVGNATFGYDEETHSIVVSADDDTLRYISEVIKEMDRPQPQVLIKVVFLEVTHNNSLDFGIEGQYTGKSSAFGKIASYLTNYNIFTNTTITSTTGGSTTTSQSTSILPSTLTPINNSYIFNNNFGLANQGANPNGAGVYQILGEDFTATIRAIAQTGKAQLLSRPSILARNNQPATIQVGQNVPLITNVRYDTFGNAINSVSYQAVGIILHVTPFITSDGMVQMIVQPSTSAIDPSTSIPISAGVTAPVIDVRS